MPCLCSKTSRKHLSIFNQWAPQVRLPPTLRTLYKELSDASPDVIKKECENIIKTLKYDNEQLLFVEETTKNQSMGSIWYDQRIGLITGSIAHQALSTPSTSLIKKIFQSQCSLINSAAIRWGRDHEHVALSFYKNAMLKDNNPNNPKLITNTVFQRHTNFECINMGLVVDREYPWLGASPDAAFHCTCCEYGVIEIKCPYSVRKSLLTEAINGKVKNFYVVCENDFYSLRQNHPYFTQVQIEMRVTEQNYVTLLYGRHPKF